ncbi:replication initiation protein [Vibrio alginolyticus]|uniref:replication initiation protein n=1 Tax=Vibrio alginolyticus TaxID=663 RepID=UPI001BD55C32|nr:replication initiation protein [Vibrio alginolyticus]MBS9899134.1 replication initiation protein [Vibrio alginolyticus]
MGKLTIVHANELVEASYNLSIDELRVIALASTKVDSRSKNVGEIRIDVSEFSQMFNLDKNHRVYSDLREAVRALMRKPVRLFDGNEVIELAWLQMNKYSIDNGSHVIIEFSPRIEPYLFELKERFTEINLEYAARLNTPFSFRLYQWLYKEKNLRNSKVGGTVVVVLDVEWMKSQAVLDGNYDRWDNFNNRVISPAIERINAHTDLSVIYKPIKTGRKVTAVKFTYVVEHSSVEKPLRPRLMRRPKVTKGSHDEGIWMRKNLALLLDYEAKLKAYDLEAKLTLPDLRKMVEYASIAEPELQQRLRLEIENRTTKKAA